MNRRQIAEQLLDLAAVSLNVAQPFTWSSGLRSPVYCDNRLLISSVPDRRRVIAAFVDLIQTHFPDPDVIAGTATAGIPHAAWLAEALAVPMAYVRSSEKKHGKKNLVEGRVRAGQRVVLIEDLISTGGSVIKAAAGLHENGAEVVGVAAIFSYGFDKARRNLEQASLKWRSLTDLETLIAVAADRNELSVDDRQTLDQWRMDPVAWSDARA